MKISYLISFFIFSLIPSSLFSQSPQSIPYQAVVRNADGTAMSNAALTMIFKIHDVTATGTVVYQESQALTSNAQGLVSCFVGNGTAAQGTFANINWGSGAKFLHVLMNAGNGEVDLGTQQMMSVPYALYSNQSNNGISRVSLSGDSLILNNGNFVLIPGISVVNHPVYGCMDSQACNFNSLANLSDNSCFYRYSNCDDGNTLTYSDFYNSSCLCLGLADELVPRIITDGGVCLSDTIFIEGYGAQDTVTLSSSIEYVFANMEHSYLGDITIRLICPDSSSIMIEQQYGGGIFLGEPIDGESLTPGLGYNYIWSNNSTNGSWSSQTVTTIPSGSYLPNQSFADLIGCPFNGPWILEICDLGANDNGFLFDWGIHLLSN